jgi:hypothetical protein
MMKIQPISPLSCSLAVILVAISPLAVLANDYSRSQGDDSIKPISPEVQRSGQPDDSIKPLRPQVQRSGNADESIKPKRSQVQRFGTNDDGIKPVVKLQRLSPSTEILKPVVPKQPLPAQKTKAGQDDESI